MITEIEAKSILTRNKEPLSWFGVDYNINIYRGCQHGCVYCDSRSDCYQINDFDHEIIVKKNGPQLLEQSLYKKRKKLIIGSGAMSDCYMPIEKTYGLFRTCLEVIDKYNMGMHISTKSDLILRDVDILKRISRRFVSVAMTITTAEDELAKSIEPGAPSPSRRFEAMKQLNEMGINTGILMMPQLPYLMENRDHIDRIINSGVESGVTFIIPYFGVTLRRGNREYYYKALDDDYRGLSDKYRQRFGESYSAPCVNSKKMSAYFKAKCAEKGISVKMPLPPKREQGKQMCLFEE